jgi:hypothetical protein
MNRPKVTVIALVMLTGGMPQALLAQREASTSRTLDVRRSGAAEGLQWPDVNLNPPESLTPSQLSSLFAVGGVAFAILQGPWKLSPSSMVAAGGRFRIAFKEAQSVTAWAAVLYGRPSVTIGQATPGVLLSLRALAAGERYSIDCTAGPPKATYRLTAPGISRTFTGDGHIDASYTAPDTQPVIMRIERLDSDDPWGFFACDISRIQ